MRNKHPRAIGTTEDAILRAEVAIGLRLPPSFRSWLLTNNGLGVHGVSIFPVRDERDIRKTWDSIDRKFLRDWRAAAEYFGEGERCFSHLVPFADFGTGDFYCFDYSTEKTLEEVSVVRWSHETGDSVFRASSFAEFVSKLEEGQFKND